MCIANMWICYVIGISPPIATVLSMSAFGSIQHEPSVAIDVITPPEQSVSSFGQVVLHVFVIAASVIGIGDGKICKIGIIRSLALPPVCSLDTVKLLAIDMIVATDTQIDISPRIVVILEIDPVT